MAERGSGYMATPHPHGASAAPNMENVDRALREMVMMNARKQYEDAKRALRIRAEQEAHEQAKAQAAQAHAQAQAQARARAQAEARAQAWHSYSKKQTPQNWPQHQMQTQMQARIAHSRADPRPQYPVSTPVQVPTQTNIYRPLKTRPYERASTPGYPTSIPKIAHSPILQSYQQPRLSPAQSSSSVIAVATTSKMDSGNALELDELKRRYYAQLAGNGDPVRRRPYGSIARPSVNVRVDRPHQERMQATSGGQGGTIADKYLDYYMPARRGPQPSPIHYDRQEISVRQYEKRRAEDTDYDVTRRHPFRRPLQPEPRRTTPERPVQRPVVEVRPVIERPSIAYNHPKEEPVVRPPSLPLSKGKLSFLLNPSELSTSPRRSPESRERKVSISDQSPEPVERSASKAPLAHPSREGKGTSEVGEQRPATGRDEHTRSPYMLRRTVAILDGKQSSSEPGVSRPVDDSEILSSQLRTTSGGSHSSDTPNDDIQERTPTTNVPRQLPRVSYGRPEKRKATSPDSPQSEASDEDAAPRAKRRTFGRLPDDDDTMSDLSPEEEEVMEERVLSDKSTNGGDAKPDGEESIRHDEYNRHTKSQCATDGTESPGLRVDTSTTRKAPLMDAINNSPNSVSSPISVRRRPASKGHDDRRRSLHESVDEEMTPLSRSKHEGGSETAASPRSSIGSYAEVAEPRRSRTRSTSDENKVYSLRPRPGGHPHSRRE